MRTLLTVILFLAGNVLLAQQSNFIKNRPFIAHVVEDYGSFLSTSDEKALEKELISFREKKGYSIVIITLSSLTDNTGYTWPVEEAALQYFNKWGIGNKRSNNGVLILLSKEPRRIRIATGTGVEANLTDGDCQRIINKTIVPNFKMGRYYAGLKEGVQDIESELTGWASSSAPANHVHSGGKAPAADNWTTADEPAQPQALARPQQQQPQPAAQPVNSTEKMLKNLTATQIISGSLMLALITWLRVRWVNANRRRNAATLPEDENVSGNTGGVVMDYVNALGWVFLWWLKIVGWTLLCCFGIFAIFFGYNVWKGRSFSSGSARASFGGGRSDGGGATGSW